MSKAFELAIEGADLAEVVEAAEEKSFLVHELVAAGRWDLITELSDDAEHGERARKAMECKQLTDKNWREWQAKAATYPPIFLEWRDILLNTPKVGYYDVSYPSMAAQVAKLVPEDYVAISGDGLFLFMLRIISLEASLFEVCTSPKFTSTGDGRYISTHEREFLSVSEKSYGDTISGAEVTDALAKMYSSDRNF